MNRHLTIWLTIIGKVRVKRAELEVVEYKYLMDK